MAVRERFVGGESICYVAGPLYGSFTDNDSYPWSPTYSTPFSISRPWLHTLPPGQFSRQNSTSEYETIGEGEVQSFVRVNDTYTTH